MTLVQCFSHSRRDLMYSVTSQTLVLLVRLDVLYLIYCTLVVDAIGHCPKLQVRR